MKCSTTSAATWFFLSTNNPEKKKQKKKKKKQQEQQQRRDRNKYVHCDRCCTSSSLYNPTGLRDLFSIRAHGFARDDVDAQDCRTRAQRRDQVFCASFAREREREREGKQAGRRAGRAGQTGAGETGRGRNEVLERERERERDFEPSLGT
jgi:hypothetical protein